MPHIVHMQPIDLADVTAHSEERYNSSNHWQSTNRQPPKDYAEVLQSFDLPRWIDLFRRPESYKTFRIDDVNALSWLKKAEIASAQRGAFSSLFVEELEDFLKEYKVEDDRIFGLHGAEQGRYFARCAGASMKYGQHGAGPYTSLRMVVESVVSCVAGHKVLFEDTQELIVYLFPWVAINPMCEYRVFVHDGSVVGISQQHWYRKFPDMVNTINQDVSVILQHYDEVVSTVAAAKDYHNFVYDIAVLDKTVPYFIEFNSFGKDYSSGSALFHWEHDEPLLLCEKGSEDVYVRYVV